MLVLTRKVGETICIGPDIQLTVLDAGRGRVKLGFAGPRSISIRRAELTEAGQPSDEQLSAVMRKPSAPGSPEPRTAAVYPPLREFRVVAGLR